MAKLENHNKSLLHEKQMLEMKLREKQVTALPALGEVEDQVNSALYDAFINSKSMPSMLESISLLDESDAELTVIRTQLESD